MKRNNIEERTILLCLSGSQLYRTNTPESDFEYKGICIPTIDNFFGTKNFEQKDSFPQDEENNHTLYPQLTETDTAIYSIKKYINLAIMNNPNILEILWAGEYDYLYLNSYGRKLIEIREEFLSQKIYHSYSGYAIAQLNKVKKHRNWLLKYRENPDFFNKKPIPSDYGIEDNPLSKEQLHTFLEFLYVLVKDASQYSEQADYILSQIDYKGLLKQYKLSDDVMGAVQYYTRSTSSFMYLLSATQRFREAMQEYESYHTWKKNRNSKRAIIEEKIGYDCYADDTEFLTKNGWKLYKDISDFEEIATFDVKTQHLEFQIPTERCEYDSPENLLSVSNRYTECLITYNHNLFVSKFTRKPSSNYSTEYNDNPFELTTFETLKDFHIINSLEPQSCDYAVDDVYLQIMAAYVTEGTIQKRKNKNSTVCKSLRIEQKCGNRLEPWLLSMVEKGIFKKYKSEKLNRPHNMPDYNGNIYIVSDRNLCEKLIQDCGEGSKNKKLPYWTMFLSQRQVLVVIDVMMNADGTNKKTGRVLYTSSLELANSFQSMCICSGIKCLIWECLDIKGGFNSTHDMYQVYVPYDLNRCSAVSSIRNIKQIESPVKKVVCFTTKNGTLITRRNFKVSLHGNSKHISHCYRLLKMGIELLNGQGLEANREIAGDARFIKEIRSGNVVYEDIIKLVDNLQIDLDDALKTTSLPKYPNVKFIEEVQIELISKYITK